MALLRPARRVRLVQPPDRRRAADHRARRPAELHRDRRQRRRHAGRPGRSLAACRARGGRVRQLAARRRTRSCCSSATSSPRRRRWPLHNVYSVGDLLIVLGVLVLAARAPAARASCRAAGVAPPGVAARPERCCARRSPTRPSRALLRRARAVLPRLRPRVRRAAAARLRPLRLARGRSPPCCCPTCCRRSCSGRCSARWSTASAGARARSRPTCCAALAFALRRLWRTRCRDDARRRARRYSAPRCSRPPRWPALAALAPGDRAPAAMGLFGALDDLGLTAGPALAAVPARVRARHRAARRQRGLVRRVRALLIASVAPARAARRDRPSTARCRTDARAGVRELGGRPEIRAAAGELDRRRVLCIGITNVGEVRAGPRGARHSAAPASPRS